MNIERKIAERSLKVKGFIKDKSKDHVFYRFCFKGREAHAYTYFSHSKKIKTVTMGLIHQMQKQLRLDTPQEVFDLLTCPMSERDYISKLKSKGELR